MVIVFLFRRMARSGRGTGAGAMERKAVRESACSPWPRCPPCPGVPVSPDVPRVPVSPCPGDPVPRCPGRCSPSCRSQPCRPWIGLSRSPPGCSPLPLPLRWGSGAPSPPGPGWSVPAGAGPTPGTAKTRMPRPCSGELESCHL